MDQVVECLNVYMHFIWYMVQSLELYVLFYVWKPSVILILVVEVTLLFEKLHLKYFPITSIACRRGKREVDCALWDLPKEIFFYMCYCDILMCITTSLSCSSHYSLQYIGSNQMKREHRFNTSSEKHFLISLTYLIVLFRLLTLQLKQQI